MFVSLICWIFHVLKLEGEKDKEDGQDWVRKSSTSSIINIMSTMMMVMVVELYVSLCCSKTGGSEGTLFLTSERKILIVLT